MGSVLKEARKAFSTAQWHLNVLLNLTEVPDHHPVSLKASQLWSDLEYVLGKIPQAGRQAKLMFEDGPVVIPIQGKSPDQWMTSSGKSVQACQMLSPSHTRLAAAKKLRMPRVASQRRAMTKGQFLASLQAANPESLTGVKLEIPLLSAEAV